MVRCREILGIFTVIFEDTIRYIYMRLKADAMAS